MFRAVNTFMEDRVQIINLAQVEHVQINSISTIVKIYTANLPLSHEFSGIFPPPQLRTPNYSYPSLAYEEFSALPRTTHKIRTLLAQSDLEVWTFMWPAGRCYGYNS